MSHYERFPKIRERYLEVAKLLPKYLQDSLVSFKKAFPDFTAPFQAHLIHSLGEMDGGTRTLNGKFYFLFGVDRIAEEHKHLDFKSKQPFLHHEIFHVYHRQFFTDGSSLVPGLWSEGLAVLTAAELNPKATLAQLSMDNPKDLVQKCEKVRAKLIADIKERVERPGPEDYEMYFFSSSEHPWIPKRAGYFVGYRIATLARKQKSLAELAKLNVEEVKALILSLIDKI